MGKRLIAELGLPSVNNGQLALLIANLIHTNETTLGRDSPHKSEMTKLPMRLFHDYKPNGGVFVILKTYFQLKSEFSFSAFPPHEALRILKAIQQNLIVRFVVPFPLLSLADIVFFFFVVFFVLVAGQQLAAFPERVRLKGRGGRRERGDEGDRDGTRRKGCGERRGSDASHR